MKTKITTLEGKSAGEMDLREDVFGLAPRKDILQRMVEWQRAKKRAGTHKTKTIGEISGGGKKPWKQKGTGHARQGSRRAAQWVGGQTTFGPVVRSHAYHLNKKFRKLGLKMALSAKQAAGSLIVIDEAKGKKTKDMAQAFAKLGWKKPLIVDATLDQHFVKAARNIKHVDVLPTIGINVHDILRHKELVLTKAAIESLEERLS